MSQPAEPPALSPASHSFFFDVDGCLVPIQLWSDEVVIAPGVITVLTELAAASDQALALISERSSQQLDTLFSPLYLPLAGIHGAERRDALGNVYEVILPEQIHEEVTQRLQLAIAALPGVELKIKNKAFALHYRKAPHQATKVLALAQMMVDEFQQLTLQQGKCVAELKPAGCDKGMAIACFMQEAPFAGRIPVSIGDDLTDEIGFAVVNALNGYTIKVGEGQTVARYRLADVGAVHDWLEQLLLQ